jgi:CheY-like chemotaxis protein
MPKLKILIVDDEEYIRKASKKLIEKHLKYRNEEGYEIECIEASSAKMAIEFIERKNKNNNDPEFALILLDIVMEDSGFDVIKYLKSEQNYLTQVIIVSGMMGRNAPDIEEVIDQYQPTDVIVKGDPSYGIDNQLKQFKLALYNFEEKRKFKQDADNREEELKNLVKNFNSYVTAKIPTDEMLDESFLKNYIENLTKVKDIKIEINNSVYKKISMYRDKGMIFIIWLIEKALFVCSTTGRTLTNAIIEELVNDPKSSFNKIFTTKFNFTGLLVQKHNLYLYLLGFNEQKVQLIQYIHFPTFDSHLNGFVVDPKIIWLGNDKTLLHLLFELSYHLPKSYLENAKNSIPQIICDHFILKGQRENNKNDNEKKIATLKVQLSANWEWKRKISEKKDYTLSEYIKKLNDLDEKLKSGNLDEIKKDEYLKEKNRLGCNAKLLDLINNRKTNPEKIKQLIIEHKPTIEKIKVLKALIKKLEDQLKELKNNYSTENSKTELKEQIKLLKEQIEPLEKQIEPLKTAKGEIFEIQKLFKETFPVEIKAQWNEDENIITDAIKLLENPIRSNVKENLKKLNKELFKEHEKQLNLIILGY